MMQGPLKLVEIFLAHAPAHAVAPQVPAEAERLLHQAWEKGGAPWPEVALPAEVFARHLAARLPEGGEAPSLESLLESLALEELYLACACAHAVPQAVERLEKHYLSKLPAQLAHLKQPPAVVEDLCQGVRVHLLLGTAESPPRIAEYTGRGALSSWLRVIAVRLALKQRAATREQPEENVLAALEATPAPGLDAELELIKRRYHHEFRQALRESFAALSGEQRHLLRLHFIERLTTTEMGPLFRVNQSTVSRWLKSARQSIYEETRRRLKERLNLSSQEFESLLALIDSQIDVSFSQFLKEGG